jgi:DNA-binding response OmpR family regulator
MKTLFENTILIVDDTPENIEILVELLDEFDTKIAINGLDALETAFDDVPPDLILLDIMMPEMDGYEVCRRLRANERTKDVPVIFLTAKTLKDDIVLGFEAGGQDYVTKPFDARELMERVKTQLELKTQREILKNMNVILEEKVRERTAALDKANKELQGLDVAKNNFLMMISHELRTPLNGIVGATYFLNDTMDKDSELAEFVEILKGSVDRLEKFSTTALVITQLQTDSALTKKTLDLREIAGNCINQNNESAAKKEIILTEKFSEDSCLSSVNLDLVTRAINSVIENAIKYGDQKSVVTVKVYPDSLFSIVEVIDRGIGFSQVALDNLFKPFGLGEKHYDKNLGLSLKATMQIMEAHNGKIEVNNLPEGGATEKLLFQGN